MRTVVCVSGASGALYAVGLLRALQGTKVLVATTHGKMLIEHEWGPFKDVAALADEQYDDGDLAAPVSSGSNRFDAVVIVPCSISTIGKLAAGVADTLVTRVAAVALKERRPLILVPRETPLNLIQLRNLVTLTEAGATVLYASPGFYHHPKTIDDLGGFIVGKILNLLGQDSSGVLQSWEGMKPRP